MKYVGYMIVIKLIVVAITRVCNAILRNSLANPNTFFGKFTKKLEGTVNKVFNYFVHFIQYKIVRK